MKRKCTPILLIVLMTLSSTAWTQGYIIGQNDVLSVSFWQDPEMDFQTRVGTDGSITLAMGGSIEAAGLTPEELAKKIVEQVSLFNRKITHAAVKINEYGSRRITVMGNVGKPGQYTFESIPNLWEIISEAGGPTLDANLSNIMIIRADESETEAVLKVDLVEALRRNDFASLPQIKPGDDIYIPPQTGDIFDRAVEEQAAPRADVLYIFGAVNVPGVHKFDPKLNILESLVVASGPTFDANLKSVRIIRKNGAHSAVTRFNVDRFLHERVADSFKLRGGDAIYVPQKKSFRDTILFNFLMIAAGAAITAYMYDYVTKD